MRIKDFATLLFLCLVIPGTLSAQLTERQRRERAIATELDTQRQELLTLEKENVRATMQHNATFFHRVYADDYSGVLASGEAVDRSGVATAVQNSPAAYTSLLPTDINIRVYEATAVVSCTWTARGTEGGRAFSRQFRVLHVYLNGIGGWKIVASQELQLPG